MSTDENNLDLGNTPDFEAKLAMILARAKAVLEDPAATKDEKTHALETAKNEIDRATVSAQVAVMRKCIKNMKDAYTYVTIPPKEPKIYLSNSAKKALAAAGIVSAISAAVVFNMGLWGGRSC